MKETTFKIFLTMAFVSVSSYMGQLLIPIIILAVTMIIDYCTGLTYAWINRSLSSRQGVLGIIKKIGYLVTVAVAMVVDYIITQTVIDFDMPISFGLIVTIWLIITELISILENLNKIGVPMPNFLITVISKLKTQIDDEVK